MSRRPSCPSLRGSLDKVISGGPKSIERHIRALEEWLAEIAAQYPWPALEASVRRDIERLNAAAGR